jgi:hypothetical protein
MALMSGAPHPIDAILASSFASGILLLMSNPEAYGIPLLIDEHIAHS